MSQTKQQARPCPGWGRRTARWLLAILLVSAVAAAGAAYYAGTQLTAPMASNVGAPPADLPVEPVAFDSASGSRLSGWFIAGKPGQGAVLLLHGIGANRLQMLERARFLHDDGFAVLLFDFQAEGESPGQSLTFGYLEARDARAAFDFLRARTPGERIGVIGLSLGGAAAVLADKPLEVEAMVLKSVYADFETAVSNRMVLAFGPPGRYLTPLLTMQVKPRLGFSPSELQPAERISRIHAPVLLIAGAADSNATLDEQRRLFANANSPKEVWVIEDAGHVDFHAVAPEEYERRVLDFLRRSLRH